MAENENAPTPATAETGGETTGSGTGSDTPNDNNDAPTTTAVTAEEQSGASETETETPQQSETPAAEPAPPEEISYHAVEKDGHVTAIWEMQGRKHLRTIDPRSRQGEEILRLYTAEHPE